MVVIIVSVWCGVFCILSIVMSILYCKVKKEMQKQQEDSALSRKKVHHKVKNDLQVMMSIFNLQAHMADDPQMQEIMTCVSGRVFSLALIHQLIYRSEKESLVDITEYIRQLGKMKTTSKASGQSSYLLVSSESIYLPEKTATTAGLVINEILDNALLHGTNNKLAVILPVVVTVLLNDGIVTIKFRDVGSGYMPSGNADSKAISLGATLIKTLTSQLGGSIIYHTGSDLPEIDQTLFQTEAVPPLPPETGTEAELRFPALRE